MNDHKLRHQICYRLLQITALFLACYFTLGNLVGTSTFSPWHMVCAGLTVLFLAGINYSKLKGRLFCLFALSGGFFLLYLIIGPETLLSFWNNYLNRIIRDNQLNENFVRGFDLVQTVIMALSCYLLQLLLEHFPPLRKILSVVILAALLYCMFSKYPISHQGVVFCFWYLIITLLEEIQRKWEKNSKHHQKLYMVKIMPFCVIYLILLLLTPTYEEPYQWQWAKDFYQQVRERVILCYEDILRGGNDDFALSGFSGNGKLSGALRGNHRHVLTIQKSPSLVTNVYLTGKVYGHFDGGSWQQICTNNENDRLLDALETIYAVSLYDDLPGNYIAYTNLKIRYEHFSSSYLFAPLKSLKIEDCEYTSHGDCLLFDEQKGYGTTYDVYYSQLNLNEPAFYRMLETAREPDEAVWDKIAKRYSSQNDAPITTGDLEEHRTHIRENYTEKPLLSEEAEEYLQKITQGAETDLEKLLAIEAELSSYTYTDNPGPLPDSVTTPEAFLDYFLLKNSQGYCCHFATAFVLLARAEGFPARYVEGFCVPITPGKSTEVFSDMAHAWPEVYLEGVGWIPFEPTPGYGEVRYTPWQIKQQSTSSTFSAEEPDFQEEEEVIPEELPTETEESPAPVPQIWPTVLLCILLLCVAATTFWLLDQLIRRSHYRRMVPAARLRIQVEANFWLLSKLGFLRDDSETLSEFCRRIPEHCTFINCYEEILYGCQPVPEQIPEIIFSERKHLLALLKTKRKLLYPLVWLRLKTYEI